MTSDHRVGVRFLSEVLKFRTMSEPIYDNSFKKDLLKKAGFEEEVKKVDARLCPFCSTPIKMEDFRDELSRKEANISGLCQACQDDFFGI